MHELAAIQSVVRRAIEHMHQAGATRVTRVELSLAVSDHFTEDVVRQYFALFTVGTPAAEATLTIVWLPATYQCLNCQHTFQSLQPAVGALCPACGDMAMEIDHQNTCAVSVVEVAFDEPSAEPRKEQLAPLSIPGDEALPWPV